MKDQDHKLKSIAKERAGAADSYEYKKRIEELQARIRELESSTVT